MATFKTVGISLKATPFAEADKLVTLFTREQGKIKVIAKGARRIPSRLAGRVEPFSYGEYFIVKGRNLHILSQATLFETFQFIRENEHMLMSALHLLRLIHAGTAEGQANPELFDLLVHSLARFKKNVAPARIAKDFERDFLVLEGVYQEDGDSTLMMSEHLGKDIRSW